MFSMKIRFILGYHNFPPKKRQFSNTYLRKRISLSQRFPFIEQSPNKKSTFTKSKSMFVAIFAHLCGISISMVTMVWINIWGWVTTTMWLVAISIRLLNNDKLMIIKWLKSIVQLQAHFGRLSMVPILAYDKWYFSCVRCASCLTTCCCCCRGVISYNGCSPSRDRHLKCCCTFLSHSFHFVLFIFMAYTNCSINLHRQMHAQNI